MKVAVVQGGPSTEAEVSRASGAAVAAALVQAGHEVRRLELDAELPRVLMAEPVDVVFPALHGVLGEDGCLQGLLEVLGVPYVGSGVLASALACDKVAAKLCFAQAGLPLARQLTLARSAHAGGAGEQLLGEVRAALGPEFIIKPAAGGSTIGVTRVLGATSVAEFTAGLALCFELDSVALLESYHRGVEVNCGVLEGPDGPQALPPTQIVPVASDWYDFASKYSNGGSRHLCPAPLSAELTTRIQEAAIAAHRALGARDLSRSDFIIAEDGSFIVLELNNLPGMTGQSLFPEAAQAAGIPFPELLDRLVRRAQARGAGHVARGLALPG